MPVKGSRKLYKIPQIQVGRAADGTGGRPIIVKMKEPIADFLNLTPMAYNDPQLIGVFGGTGPNAGFKYVKRLGGFRQDSYRLVAETEFEISELEATANGGTQAVTNTYKSLSIGFPGGVTVNQFINWIGSTGVVGEISYIVTPSGVSFPMGAAAPPAV